MLECSGEESSALQSRKLCVCSDFAVNCRYGVSVCALPFVLMVISGVGTVRGVEKEALLFRCRRARTIILPGRQDHFNGSLEPMVSNLTKVTTG